MKCWFKLARLSLQTWASLSEQTLENAKRMNNKEKRARFRYLGHLKPGQLDGEQMSPEQRLEKIRQPQNMTAPDYRAIFLSENCLGLHYKLF